MDESRIPGTALAARSTEDLSFTADIEAWLRHQTTLSAPALWCPRGRDGIPVGGADALATKVATLTSTGEWAVLRRAEGWTWAQCMRTKRGWIVEVNGIPGPQCYVRRVQRNGASAGRGNRRVRDRGRLMAIYAPADNLGSPELVAEVMWSWLRGRLAEGWELRQLTD